MRKHRCTSISHSAAQFRVKKHNVRFLLEVGYLFVGGALRLQRLLDLLHVALEVGEVALLVEACGDQTERVHDVDDGLDAVVRACVRVLTLGGCVAAHVEGLAADGDLPAIGLVGDAVDFFEVVRVGDDLVAGENVLERGVG